MTTQKQQTTTSTEVTPTETDSGKAISATENTYLCGWCMTGYHSNCRGDLSADNGKVYQCECTCEEANLQRGSGDKFRSPTNPIDGNASKRGNAQRNN